MEEDIKNKNEEVEEIFPSSSSEAGKDETKIVSCGFSPKILSLIFGLILILVICGSWVYVLNLKKGLEVEKNSIKKDAEVASEKASKCEEENKIEQESNTPNLSAEEDAKSELEELEKLVLDEMENATWEKHLTKEGISFELPSYITETLSEINTSSTYEINLASDSISTCDSLEEKTVSKIKLSELFQKDFNYSKNELSKCTSDFGISCNYLGSQSCFQPKSVHDLKIIKTNDSSPAIRIILGDWTFATGSSIFSYYATKQVSEKFVNFRINLPHSFPDGEKWDRANWEFIEKYGEGIPGDRWQYYLDLFKYPSSERIIRKEIQDYDRIVESIQVK